MDDQITVLGADGAYRKQHLVRRSAQELVELRQISDIYFVLRNGYSQHFREGFLVHIIYIRLEGKQRFYQHRNVFLIRRVVLDELPAQGCGLCLYLPDTLHPLGAQPVLLLVVRQRLGALLSHNVEIGVPLGVAVVVFDVLRQLPQFLSVLVSHLPGHIDGLDDLTVPVIIEIHEQVVNEVEPFFGNLLLPLMTQTGFKFPLEI